MRSQSLMRHTVRALCWRAALAGVALVAMPAVAAAPGGDTLLAASEWRNPRNTVHISIRPCGGGDKMCGVVIWATDKAKADAKRGGTDNLVGLSLFREFRRTGPGEYKGRVFVPDLNRTFSGQMRIAGDSIIGKGCLIGGLFCKQQVWTRIS